MTIEPATLGRRALMLLSCAAFSRAARASEPADPKLAAVIASPHRSPANIARDRYRHPYALLSFFGLKDNLSVLEIEPGAGYWTEILAPYLQAHGHYAVALPPVPAEQHANTTYLAKLHADKSAFGKVSIVNWNNNTALAPDNATDLILSFRNLHDWLADGTAPQKLRAIYAALKPGGVFGCEDHRGLATQPQDPVAKSGYVREDYAVNLITQAGLEWAGRSTIGNNPRDTKNYPAGVWTLPPTLRLGATNRAQYLAIGESDRWTLKFKKTHAA